MNVWTWFAAPPVVLMAAYYAIGAVTQDVVARRPLPPPPAIEALRLPPSLAAAAGGTGYRRGGAPKEIRLAAFGVVVPEELVTGKNLTIVTPPASELFVLQSVLLVGENNRTATIDGKIYKAGDRLQRRYRLTKVEADAVWLKGPRGREALRFPEFKDLPPAVAAPPPPVAMQAPGKPSPSGGAIPPGKLDSEYRKILEMLKL